MKSQIQKAAFFASLLVGVFGTATAQADLYFQVGDQAEYTYSSPHVQMETAVLVRVKDVTLETITFEASVHQDGASRVCETTIRRKDITHGQVNATGCSGIDLMLPIAADVAESRAESVVTDAGEFLSDYTKYETRSNHETWTSQEVPVFGVVKQNRGTDTLSLKSFQISL